MAVFLTQNSPGLRTSPVKRGFWVVRQLLGTHIPAPPPNVPELPEDESQLGELSLREILAKHREHESCAGCHEKFDSVGLIFESYGPVGERRQRDLAGNHVQTSASFPDDSEREGVDGLRDYIRDQRQHDFVETLCRKLLSYCLGRSLYNLRRALDPAHATESARQSVFVSSASRISCLEPAIFKQTKLKHEFSISTTTFLGNLSAPGAEGHRCGHGASLVGIGACLGCGRQRFKLRYATANGRTVYGQWCCLRTLVGQGQR